MSATTPVRNTAAGSGSDASSSSVLRRNQGATTSTSATDTGARQQRRRIDDGDSNWLDDEWTSESETDYASSDAGTYVDGALGREGTGAANDDEESQLPQHHHQRPVPPWARSSQQPQRASRMHVSTASISSATTLYEGSVRSPATPMTPNFDNRGGRKYSTHKAKKPLISYVTNEWQQQGPEYDEKRKGDDQHPYYYQAGRHGHYYHPARRRRGSSGSGPSCYDEMMEAADWRGCLLVLWRRLTLRVLVTVATVLLFFSLGRWWLSSGAARHYASDGILRQSVQHRMSGGEPRGPRGRFRTWFGSHQTPDFYGLRQVASLNETTGGWQWANGKRLVIVGDVHGSAEPLESLLRKLKFDPAKDHLAFTGDLVARGPDTAGVLDIAIRYNASCVRGNHDDKLLLIHRDLSATLKHQDEMGDGMAAGAGGAGGKTEPRRRMKPATEENITGRQTYTKQRDLARTLSDEHMAYLSSCPLILDLGPLPGQAPRALLVHAGLVPGLELERQDPGAVMNMRSLDLRTYHPINVHAPSTQRLLMSESGHAPGSEADPSTSEAFKDLPPPWDAKKAKQKAAGARTFDLDERYVLPWSRVWEEWQLQQERTGRGRGTRGNDGGKAKPDDQQQQQPTLVVYGHDSALGLVDGDWAVGLDSGCANGGRLTALLLDMRRGKVRRSLDSVPCERVAKHEPKATASKKPKEAKQGKNKNKNKKAGKDKAK